MGLFKRRSREPFDVQKLYAEAHEEVIAEKARKSVIEKDVLRAIGEATNPLADKALLLVDSLPEPERTLFLQNVLQKLVLQALDSASSYGENGRKQPRLSEEANRFGGQVVRHYGTGMPSWGNSSLESVVIEESMPVYEQPTLEAPQNA